MFLINRLILVIGNNGLAIFLMVMSALIIPIGDSIAKYLSDIYPIIFLSFSRFFSGFLLILPVVIKGYNFQPVTWKDMSMQFIHSILLVLSVVFFFYAIKYIYFVDALGLYFLSPIIASLLSFFVLHESLSVGKCVGIGSGFLGAILIIKPGVTIDIGTLYGLGASVCFAAYLVTTRVLSQKGSHINILAAQYLIGTVILAPFALTNIPSFGFFEFFLLMSIGAISLISHGFQIKAFKLAPVSVLAPLVYFEIVSAIVIGHFIFNEQPDFFTVMGIIIICIEGLLILKAEWRHNNTG